MADLERQARAARKEAERAAVVATEKALTTLHLASFPPASPGRVPDPSTATPAQVAMLAKQKRKQRTRGVSPFDRQQRRQIAQACAAEAAAELQRRHWADVIRAQRAQLEEDTAWAGLLAHEPRYVIENIDAAFADNDSVSTCVDAGLDEYTGRRYATCLVLYGTPEMIPEVTPSITPGGKPTLKKRTKTDRNALYLLAMASTVLATVNEALAVSPSTDEVRVVVARQADAHLTGFAQSALVPIYQGTVPRHLLDGCDWSRLEPVRVLTGLQAASLRLKGTTNEVVPITATDPSTHELLAAVEEALMRAEC